MFLDYSCSKEESESTSWMGKVHLKTTTNPYELTVTARHSGFYIICGSYAYGNYLCIPDLGISSELADFGDTFWNLERLMMNNPDLAETDAISITYALKAISPYVDI